MKIPPKYQVFAEQVFISDKDEDRLQPHLSSWRALHLLMATGVNEPDLHRMIVLELVGAQRKHILQRLIGRLSTVRDEELTRRIERCLKTK